MTTFFLFPYNFDLKYFLNFTLYTDKFWLNYSNLISLVLISFCAILIGILFSKKAAHIKIFNLILAYYIVIFFYFSSLNYNYSFINLNLSFNQNTTLFVNLFIFIASITVFLFFFRN